MILVQSWFTFSCSVADMMSIKHIMPLCRTKMSSLVSCQLYTGKMSYSLHPKLEALFATMRYIN